MTQAAERWIETWLAPGEGLDVITCAEILRDGGLDMDTPEYDHLDRLAGETGEDFREAEADVLFLLGRHVAEKVQARPEILDGFRQHIVSERLQHVLDVLGLTVEEGEK